MNSLDALHAGIRQKDFPIQLSAREVRAQDKAATRDALLSTHQRATTRGLHLIRYKCFHSINADFKRLSDPSLSFTMRNLFYDLGDQGLDEQIARSSDIGGWRALHEEHQHSV